jgi:hypothetical protein
MSRKPITITLDKAKTILQQEGEIVIVPRLKTSAEYIDLQNKLNAFPYFDLNTLYIDIDTNSGNLLLYPYYKFRLNANSCLTRAKLGEKIYAIFSTVPKW